MSLFDNFFGFFPTHLISLKTEFPHAPGSDIIHPFVQKPHGVFRPLFRLVRSEKPVRVGKTVDSFDPKVAKAAKPSPHRTILRGEKYLQCVLFSNTRPGVRDVAFCPLTYPPPVLVVSHQRPPFVQGNHVGNCFSPSGE